MLSFTCEVSIRLFPALPWHNSLRPSPSILTLDSIQSADDTGRKAQFWGRLLKFVDQVTWPLILRDPLQSFPRHLVYLARLTPPKRHHVASDRIGRLGLARRLEDDRFYGESFPFLPSYGHVSAFWGTDRSFSALPHCPQSLLSLSLNHIFGHASFGKQSSFF